MAPRINDYRGYTDINQPVREPAHRLPAVWRRKGLARNQRHDPALPLIKLAIFNNGRIQYRHLPEPLSPQVAGTDITTPLQQSVSTQHPCRREQIGQINLPAAS